MYRLFLKLVFWFIAISEVHVAFQDWVINKNLNYWFDFASKFLWCYLDQKWFQFLQTYFAIKMTVCATDKNFFIGVTDLA